MDPAEGDSMNEYLSAADKAAMDGKSGPAEAPPPAAGKKTKKEAKEDKSPKRRKADAVKETPPLPAAPLAVEESVKSPAADAAPAAAVHPTEPEAPPPETTTAKPAEPEVVPKALPEPLPPVPSICHDVDMTDVGGGASASSGPVEEANRIDPPVRLVPSVELGSTKVTTAAPDPPPPLPVPSPASIEPPPHSSPSSAQEPPTPVPIPPPLPVVEPAAVDPETVRPSDATSEKAIQQADPAEAVHHPPAARRLNSTPAEQRHSKILRQAELFNHLLTHSRTDPAGPPPPAKNTMTLERPKKVIIYDFKVAHQHLAQSSAQLVQHGTTHSTRRPSSLPFLPLSIFRIFLLFSSFSSLPHL